MATLYQLGWVDSLVIALTLLVSVGIGIYYRFTGGKQKTVEEYFSANKSMGIIPIGIALMVSFMSAITLLGVSAENYIYGSQFVVINISYLIGTPLINYGYLPVFYKLQATSVYEYLEKRFGVATRTIASMILWIQMLLYSGVVLYAPALAFKTTTTLSLSTSILAVGLACSFYSSIGGIKAVLITDIFQAVLMFASLIMIISTAAYSTGSLGEIWNIAERGGRLNLYNISLDPTERHTWWSLIIGGLFTYLSLYGINQIQVQRLLTVKDLKASRKALWISFPILTLLSILTCFSGLAIYSKYWDCDPLSQDKDLKSDMLMPLYVIETMRNLPGLPGLFIAGILSAGLSTISASLNSLSAVTLEDYIKPLYFKFKGQELLPSKALILGKILSFIFGILCIAIAVLAQYLGSVLQTSLTIFGVVGGPLLGLFTLGMLFESASQLGGITGSVTAIIFLLWIAFGGPRPPPTPLPVSIEGCVKNITDNLANITSVIPIPNTLLSNHTNSQVTLNNYFYLYRISYMWYAPLGSLITITLGLIVSNISKRLKWEPKHSNVDPDLFFPCITNRILKRQKKELKEADSSKYIFDKENSKYNNTSL